MGIEPTSIESQSVVSAHLASSIWAHLGAQFNAFREQNLSHFVDRVTLGIADYMAINSERDSRIRVPHLILRDSRICSHVHQQGSVSVPKSVHPAPWNF